MAVALPTHKPYGACLAATLAAYAATHFVVGEAASVPPVERLVTLAPSGELSVLDREQLEWFAPKKEVERLEESAMARAADLKDRRTLLVDYLEQFDEISYGSSEQRVAAVRAHLAAGEYTKAQVEWRGIRDATSPSTMAKVADLLDKGDEAIRQSVQLMDFQRAGLESLEVARPHPLLHTARPALRREGAWWGLIGVLGALWLRWRGRTRDALAGELWPRSLDATDLARIAAAPAAGFALVLLGEALSIGRGALVTAVVPIGLVSGWIASRGVRDTLRRTELPSAPGQVGVVPPSALAADAAAEARAAEARRTRRRTDAAARAARAERRRQVQVMMSRLHPKSFSELKAAAQDFARELAIIEVQDVEARS